MPDRTSHPATLLLMGGILLSGCMSLSSPGIDPHFAGFHSRNPAHKLTPAIPDRDVHVEVVEAGSSEEPVLTEAAEEPVVEAGRYRNYYRDPYYGNGGFRFNLSYHLYGPNHYRSPRSRAWLAHQRRWSRLPWYADPYSSYFWWNDPLYGFGYDPWYVDPWYYDPWYYDPWYYDPYGGYGYAYNYYGGWWHGGYGGSTWYGDHQHASGSDQVKTRRPRNRRGLPTGPGPRLTAHTQLGSAMTGVARSKSGTASSGKASATAKSKGSATKRKRARSANRRERAAKSSEESSTSGSSASTKSTRSSKSSSSSSSGKTARPRNRKK
ncbi:MAG: hypothetical protein V3U35_04495 [Candidatus Neomarinimicrobiota bacterium]